MASTTISRAWSPWHAAAVVVITAPGEPPAGFTATSFTSVSLDPPLVSFCLAVTSGVAPQAAAAEALLRQLLTELGAEVAEPGLPVVEAELPEPAAIAEKYAAALRL